MFKTRTHSQIRNSGGVLNLHGIKPVRTDKADRLEHYTSATATWLT